MNFNNIKFKIMNNKELINTNLERYCINNIFLLSVRDIRRRIYSKPYKQMNESDMIEQKSEHHY